jgi:hypothetical protein
LVSGFTAAAASSLDLHVMADFSRAAAPHYHVLRNAIPVQASVSEGGDHGLTLVGAGISDDPGFESLKILIEQTVQGELQGPAAVKGGGNHRDERRRGVDGHRCITIQSHLTRVLGRRVINEPGKHYGPNPAITSLFSGEFGDPSSPP